MPPLAAAVALLRLTGWLVWDRLVPRYSGLRIPRLLRQFVAVLVMARVVLGVLTQIWGVALIAVLATTGVLGLALGLALPRILTDCFSGIALNVEQPFHLSFPSPVSEHGVDIVLDWVRPQGVAEALLGAAVTEAWMRGAAAGDMPPKLRMCRLDGRGVTWRITYLLDPRRKAKARRSTCC